MSARILACVLLSVLLTGCWVFDEIDAGNAWMDRHSPDATKQLAEDAPPPNATGFDWVLEKTQALWTDFAEGRGFDTRGERTIEPGQTGSGMVRCKIDGSFHWMSVGDCGARGGRSL